MRRRTFLKHSAVAAAGLAASPAIFSCNPQKPNAKDMGVQIYTVREQLQNDFEGTIKAISDIGYSYVELFDFGGGNVLGKPVAEAKKIFDDYGLNIKSVHCLTGQQAPDMEGTLVNNWEKGVEDALVLETDYLVCAYLLDFERENIEQYRELAELFNRSGETCASAGIQFGYHNHDFEFMELDREIPYDILLNETDPELVKMELDIYWVDVAGRDPVQLFNDNPGRYPLWHVKDREKGGEGAMTEVGNGRIDWKAVFEAAETSGLDAFFVEQDANFTEDALSSLQSSFNYLQNADFVS